ncbi:Mobile element protein [Candidatus Enterovibrio escicola]|uniref:Mobile element protein n=1 Tax=Candidatus Enterovibrio escicola TaxID=1927127 RepID=A0A2A5T3M0_9GAMM|nr:Mobile element protein [Candidatus Enterovibrio escacola]
MHGVLVPLCSYLTHRQARPTGIAFVDLSKLQLCHNLHILRYQVFKGIAKRGQGTMGWFYSFKLHLIINNKGGIMSVKLTWMIKSLYRKWLTSFVGVYTGIKVISLLH